MPVSRAPKCRPRKRPRCRQPTTIRRAIGSAPTSPQAQPPMLRRVRRRASQASPKGEAKPRPVTRCAVAGGAGGDARPLTPAPRRAKTLPRYRPIRRRRARMPPSSIRGSATAAPRQARRRVRGHYTAGDRPHRRRRRRRRPPPVGLGSALPPADRGAATQNATGDGSQLDSAASGEPGAAAAAPEAARGATGYLRLPVRRRRRLPRPPGLQRGAAEVAPPNGDTPAGDTAVSAPRAEGEFPPRRRRRRPPPRIGEAVPAGQDQSADSARRDTPRPPHGRGPNRRPGEERLARRSTSAIWGAATSRARPRTA